MDFEKVIIELLGIQEVDIEEINIHKKSCNVRVIVRQKRSKCYCSKCGLQFDKIKDWIKREIKAPPMGVYNVKIILFQMRGICESFDRSEIAEVNWIHPQFKSMTCGFAEVAGRLMEEITCEGVSRILIT